MADQNTTFEDEKTLAETLEPEVKEVYDRLHRYASASARRKWLKRRKEAWKGAIENEMWTNEEKQELEDQDMVTIVINKCNKGIQASAAMATFKRPEAKFMPIGIDDLYVSELCKRQYDYNWGINQGNLIGYDVVEECKIGGIGFFEAYWDSNKGILGKIVLEDADPTCLYWDPESRRRDFSDTDIIKAKLRSRKYLMENYEDITDKDLDLKFDIGDIMETEGVTTGDNYKEFEGERQGKPGEANFNDNKPQIWEIQALLLITKKENWVVQYDDEGMPTAAPMEDKDEWEPSGEKDEKGRQRLKNKNGDPGVLWKRTYQKRVYRLIVGKKMLVEEENPYGLDSDRDPVCNIVPVKQQRTTTSYPMSPTSYALPINREKNKRRAQFILNVSNNANSPLVQPDGTKWTDRRGNETSPGTPGATGTVPKTAQWLPQRVASGAMESQLFGNLEDRSDRDIDDQYDTPPVLKGEVPQGMDPSGRAVLALQDMAGVMGSPFMASFEGGVENIAKVLTYLSIQNWPRGMWRRLIEESEWKDETVVEPDSAPGEKPESKVNPLTGMEEEPEEPEDGVTVGDRWKAALDLIRPEDPNEDPGISLLDLDIKIQAGSSMPTNRIARQQVALEMMERNVYDAQAVLDYTDDPMKEKILPRIREREKQAAVEAAQKEMRKK